MKDWEQDPNEKLFYRQKITGDTVSSAVWSIAPTGPTLDNQSQGADYSRIMVSGMTLGTNYILTCRLTGASGQVFENSGVIDCVNL